MLYYFSEIDSRFDDYVDIGEDDVIADRDKFIVTVLPKDDKVFAIFGNQKI